jgi:hypothetical protein
MAEDTEQQTGENTSGESTEPTKGGPPDIDKIVTDKVAESLKPIKENLDKAYKLRDEALQKVAEYEQREKEAELKRLQEAGKFKEAYEMQLAEERQKRESIEKQNIELTRDINVRSALASVDFKNDKARDSAYREIVGELVRNESGVWVHRSGLGIGDYVKAYTENEENSFLLKPRVSSGAGGSSPTQSTGTSSDKKKSLFKLSQEEVIQMAAEGKLRPQ